jgi:hypothetical protein
MYVGYVNTHACLKSRVLTCRKLRNTLAQFPVLGPDIHYLKQAGSVELVGFLSFGSIPTWAFKLFDTFFGLNVFYHIKQHHIIIVHKLLYMYIFFIF